MFEIRKHFVLFVVDDPIACRDFYVEHFAVDVDVPLQDEPWGQRHLIVRDPAGGGVDIVQNIRPDRAFAKQWFDASQRASADRASASEPGGDEVRGRSPRRFGAG